ncbi:endospore germination permease [Paenibacillus sp. CGMCC 1.16610]|uniref:Endospore germination permease n=1 Tax=Paenibacillus anseongense TaxID=2682845 RepID=A0ABW9UCQ6_9BACL|nr:MULTISPECIES: endospore germination permease [Paenibacillus]MBA2937728.1 endospore germination permease [Paenibacillus sp. CGMCC 1.16610]MVQ36786.1 endospore germination permease [Paenibacillus anseongense]
MKVSSYQMFWMVSISSIIVLSYLPLHLAAEQARQDCWISILLGGLLMMGITWVMLRVCMQNKEKTLVTFIKDLLGTFLGKIIVIVYFLLWFLQMSTIAKGNAEFVNLVLLHNTPTIIILLFMLFLISYAVYKGGITTISRCAEVIGPIFVFMLFLQLFLNPQDLDPTRIFPAYVDSGWLRILKGTFYSYSYMVDPSIILMLFFFAENKQTAGRAILWGTGISMIWGVLAALVLLFVAGPDIASQLLVPVYSLTKLVSILNFVQNIDAFYIPLWLFGAFIKLSICLFIMSYGLSEWTGIKNWKYIACSIALILLAFVVYSSYNIRISYTLKNKFLISVFYPLAYIAIPLLLWMIGSIKNRRKVSVP